MNAAADPESAYVGISYAVRPVVSDRPRFVTCCSQVFDAEGAGLEFVAYDAHEVEVQRASKAFLTFASEPNASTPSNSICMVP